MHQQIAEEKQERIALESAQAQEMRKQSLENFGETRKRKSDCGEQEKKRVKRASSTTAETMQYLQEKANKDIELRKEELVVKKAEMADRQKILESSLDQQQQLLTFLVQSQQKQQE